MAKEKTDWEGSERDYRAGILFIGNKEQGACSVINLLLISEQLDELWGLPKILKWEKEFSFPRGRADFILFHIDGSVSIVEVKDRGSDRDILCGIGQLSLYAMQAGYGLKAMNIRRILAAATCGIESQHLNDACELAGVQFECIGPVQEHQNQMQELLLNWQANNVAQ